MKKALFLLLTLPCAVAAQDINWEKSYGGRNSDYLSDLQPTPDYGFIIAGSSFSQKTGTKDSQGFGGLDYWVWKMDESGALDWQQSFGGSGTDMLQSLKLTNDGGFILGGTSDSPRDLKGENKKDECRGGNDYWIIKLDAKGHEMWQKTYGGSGQDDFTVISQTRDGGYIMGGSSSSDITGDKKEISRGNMDYWIIKINKDGQEEWQRTYGGQYADLLRTLQPTTDGGYILGGYSNSPVVSYNKIKGDKTEDTKGIGGDYWILKISNKGDVEWQQTLGGEQDEQLFSLVQTYDGGYVLAGSSDSGATGNKSKTNRNGSDIWLIKLDKNGMIAWQDTYDFGNIDIPVSIIENEDHSLLLGGYARSFDDTADEGIDDYIAFRINEKGAETWRRTVGSDGEDILSKVIETRDGGYLFAGTSNPESENRKRNKRSNKKGNISLGNDGNVAAVDNVQQTADDAINNAANDVNSTVNKTVEGVTDKVNSVITDQVNQVDPDGKFKVGGIGSSGSLLNPGKGGGNVLDGMADNWKNKGPKEGLNASRDKKTNYGNRDFWVVKLKDKDKKEKERAGIEAYPNPTSQFSNVIVGFEFDKGTLSVYDLGGRQLQSFSIDSRTVPIDISTYPEGIYIVKVATDKGEGSVKIMKKTAKN